ncbi:hypothetical protein BX666DRAFT_1884291 [Dichotomocladium elegans]|nr:hypothetical protein BX666DRAFT_1884291 [Dichotomocladium elegans]
MSKIRNWVVDPDFPRQEQLENLRYYKYAATDKSLVTKYILRHYWNWAVTLFPTWMAPNLITLTGLMLMMINVVIILLYVPDLLYTDETPRWIYFSFAAGLWLYSTLDNVDGKQARRTGTSSPLGELFDHGCDALNCTFVALLQAAALGLGHSADAAILFLVTVVGFYLSTAEEYYTGVLYLGIVNGPTEGIIASCLAFLWSGFYGAGSWHVPLGEIESLTWLASAVGEDMTFSKLFVWGMIFFFLLTHLPVCVYSIYTATQGESFRQRFGVLVNVTYPIALYTMAIILWILSPNSTVFEDKHWILFTITTGVMFGLMASNIILAHLTKSPFPSFSGILGTLWLMAILIAVIPSFTGWRIVSPSMEYLALWVLFSFSVVMYGIWASLVIDGFCRFLGISCLVIRHAEQRAVASSSASERIQEQDALLQAQEEGTPQSSSSRKNVYNTFA